MNLPFDETWQSFKLKTEAYFNEGRRLPLEVQLLAVEDVQENLDHWRQMILAASTDDAILSNGDVATSTAADDLKPDQDLVLPSSSDTELFSMSEEEDGSDLNDLGCSNIPSSSDLTSPSRKHPTSKNNKTVEDQLIPFGEVLLNWENQNSSSKQEASEGRDLRSRKIPRTPAGSCFRRSRGKRWTPGKKPVSISESSCVTEIKLESSDIDSPEKQKVKRKPGRPKKTYIDMEQDKPLFTCNQCDKKLTTDKGYRIHLKRHETGANFQCPHCDKPFYTKTAYTTHVNSHTNPVKCPQCAYTSGSQYWIDKHILAVHNKSGRVLCYQCGKSLTHQAALKRHLRACHLQHETFQCQECEYQTHTPDNLRNHVRNHHLPRKLWPCDLCDARLKSKPILEDHRQRHFQTKGYPCPQCSVGLSSPFAVRRHIQEVHGPKDFKCMHCDKRFPNKQNLRRHSVIHTGEKRFVCHLCHYRCNVGSNLRKHCKVVHKLKYDTDKNFVKKISCDKKLTKQLTGTAEITAESTAGEMCTREGSTLVPGSDLVNSVPCASGIHDNNRLVTGSHDNNQLSAVIGSHNNDQIVTVVGSHDNGRLVTVAGSNLATNFTPHISMTTCGQSTVCSSVPSECLISGLPETHQSVDYPLMFSLPLVQPAFNGTDMLLAEIEQI